MKLIRIISLLALLFVTSPLPAQRVLYILSKGTQLKQQSLIPIEYGSAFNSDTLRVAWDNDQHIVAGGFTYHGIQIATSEKENWGNQKYSFAHEYPSEFIAEMTSKGYTITELTTDGANWLAIATEVTPSRPQEFFSFMDPETDDDRREVKNLIDSLAMQQFFITDVACSGKTWNIVATYNPDIAGQIFDFPKAAQDISDYFMSNQPAGYRIAAADYGPGHYLCVMSKAKGTPQPQALLPGVENPNEVLDRFWKQQFAITHIGH